MSYYLTGDCHGQFRKLHVFCEKHKTTKADTMILLGDVGVNFSMDERDERRKGFLASLPITCLCIHGNHEERPYNMPSYRLKEWHGGLVYYEPEYPNLLFAKDGEIYDLDGKKAIVIGGAYSVDKELRLLVHIPWFPEEQPSDKIKTYVEQNLKKHDWKVDYVFSHTCPSIYVPSEKENAFGKVDHSTEEWLEQIRKKLTYERWYFGHFHQNITYTDAQVLFEAIVALGKTEWLQKLGEPLYKTGEQVMFSIGTPGNEEDGYGKIIRVDRFGSKEEICSEVTYDIMGRLCSDMDTEVLFDSIPESMLERMDASEISK